MNNENFILENSKEKLLAGECTDFLMPNEVENLKYKLKNIKYYIYKPYIDADKVILYSKKEPQIILYKINCKVPLRHQDILGSLFSLGITNNTFGDIIINNGNAYFYALPKISKYLENYYNEIGNNYITLEEIEPNFLENYEKEYETFKVNVSSLRVDNIVKSIINKSRSEVEELINDKCILINYKVVNKNSYNINEGDIISIRYHGKFKFNKVLTKTKKDKLIIEYIKYI